MPAHTDQEVSDLKKKTNREIIDDYDYLANAASSMDCTGLIPSLRKMKKRSDLTMKSISFCPGQQRPKRKKHTVRIRPDPPPAF